METTGMAGAAGEGAGQPRLMRLLEDLVRERGRMEAAALLGVNYKTLARAIEAGKLTPRLCDALERFLASGEGAAARREGMEELAQRMEKLEGEVKEMRAGLDAVRAVVAGGGAAQAEAGGETQGAAEAGDARAKTGTKRKVYRELDPLVVTVEPAEDDAEVYGAAWPLIEEWRRLQQEHPTEGRTLSWLMREERILQLELALLEEHGLTLPPETYPLTGFWRREQLDWRKEALYETRRARARRELLRWVRRVLTLGRWR